MKAESVLRVSISQYFEYDGVETMLVDCFVADLTQSSEPILV